MWTAYRRALLAWCLLPLLLTPLLSSKPGSQALGGTPSIVAAPWAGDDALRPQTLEINGRIELRDRAPPNSAGEGESIAAAAWLDQTPAGFTASAGIPNGSDLACAGFLACRTSHPRAPPA